MEEPMIIKCRNSMFQKRCPGILFIGILENVFETMEAITRVFERRGIEGHQP